MQSETIDYASLGKPVSPSLFNRGMIPDDPLKVDYKEILQQESPFTGIVTYTCKYLHHVE